MRRKLPGVLIAAFGLAFAAAPGFAHHGFNVEFDKDRCSDLTGLLSALYWENPHAYFDVDVQEAIGPSDDQADQQAGLLAVATRRAPHPHQSIGPFNGPDQAAKGL